MTERLLKKIQDMREEEKGIQSERELFATKGATLSSTRWKTANLSLTHVIEQELSWIQRTSKISQY